ncbi:DUF1684 domain-containing protein [Salinimicrobium gaetbulicola]|uniref:DUF1684 domain-containing protein n=1 Tax=Salinimicrobium gaetbulicola TaxID=999702 RepID=A0ABW3IJA8_9FLAO
MKVIITSFFLCLFFMVNAQKNEKVLAAERFQKKINKEFKDPAQSPLPEKDRKTFKGLDFFEIDTAFSVVAEFARTPFETPFAMPTTTDRKPIYVKYGELFFKLKGKEYKLNVYQNQHPKKEEYKDYLFLPFTDLTNGEESYAGGRYIDMTIPRSNRVVIDFNQAYNPYCAYSGEYSCPIPPEENDLDLAVKAGVKAYSKH